MAYLTCENLTYAYDGVPVISDLNFTVNPGDYLCIVGENGSGKSTLIKGLLDLKKPDSGKIIIGDLAFETRDEMKALRKQNRNNWLYEDMYMVYEEIEKDFEHVTWKKISKCAGIITITKE